MYHRATEWSRLTIRAHARIGQTAGMAKVRVGVKRVNPETGAEVETVGEDGIEVYQHWVEIDGVRLDGMAIGLLGVDYKLGDKMIGEITIRLSSRGIETVDHREVTIGAATLTATPIDEDTGGPAVENGD